MTLKLNPGPAVMDSEAGQVEEVESNLLYYCRSEAADRPQGFSASENAGVCYLHAALQVPEQVCALRQNRSPDLPPITVKSAGFGSVTGNSSCKMSWGWIIAGHSNTG